MHVALWIVQIALALLFLFAGGMKLVMSAEQLNQGPMTMPVWFLRFIGVCEFLGGLGLVLPGLFGIKPGLTPLAAAGLAIIMIGATVITVMMGGGVTTLIPLVVGLLLLWVAHARWKVLPLKSRH